MYPILYKSNETNFVHNGIGLLRDAITVYPEEELNGYSEITIEYDADGFLADEIKNGMIIKAKANDKQQPQLFRIYSHVKDHAADQIIINGRHITNDLADNFVEALEIRNMTTYQAMKAIQERLAYPTRFNFSSTNTTTQSSTNIYRNNPLQMVAGTEGSILQIWGGQIERDNFDLIMHRRRGSDDGVKVLYKKNLTGLQATFDDDSVVTRIYPFKYVEETEEERARLITVPGKYIDSPNIDKYPHIKILPIDASSEEGIENSTDLYNAYKDYFSNEGKDKDLPSVSMEVEFEHLHETEEYKDVAALEHVGLGDTITVGHSKWGLDLKASIVKIEYDAIAEKNRKVSAGNVKANFTDSVNQNANDLGVIGENMNNIEQKSNEAIRAANGKNTIYYGPDEPTGDHLIKGDIWFRIVDGEYTRTYIYDGIQWQLSIDMESKEAKETAAEARNRAQNAVDKANLATDNANEAIEKAQESFDKAQESIDKYDDVSKEARGAVEKAQEGFDKAEESMTRADSAFSKADALSTVVNKNTGDISSVTQIAQGLRTRVSDAEGNISTLQQTATSYGRRISDAEGNISSVTQIAQGLQTRMSDAEGNVSTVTNLANALQTRMTSAEGDINTLTLSASSLQSTIEGVRSDLDGLEIGGRNLASLDSVKKWATGSMVRDGYKYILTNANGSTNIGLSIDRTQFKNSTEYVVSFKIKKVSGTVNAIAGHRNGVASAEKVYKDGTLLQNANWNSGDKNYGNSEEVHEYVIHFTTEPNAVENNNQPFYIQPNRPSYGEPFVVEIWDLQLEEGNKKTGWSPAVEDMATKSELTQTAEEFGTKISNAQGEISELRQTSSSLATRIKDAEGDISTLTQTAKGLQTRVGNAEGEISTVTQLANTLQTKLSDAEGNINKLTQTSISLQSTIKGVRDDLDGLEVGGRNLLLNTSGNDKVFDFTGWNHPIGNISEYGVRELSKGGEFTFSADITTHTIGTTDITLILQIYRDDNTFVQYYGDVRLSPQETGKIIGVVDVPKDDNYDRAYLRVRHYSGSDPQSKGTYSSAQVEKGNKITDWSPAPEDMATQSQFSQLNNAINLRVEKGDVINQINLDTSGAYIGGNKIVLDGNVTVLGAFRVDSGHITSLNAGKITTGTLDAGRLNVINVSANSIVGGILQSQNSNTTFNMNSGLLTMRNVNFVLGNGAMIEFTNVSNRIQYSDTEGGVTRSSGFGVGKSLSGFPFSYSGTTGASNLDTLSPYWSGAIWNTTRAITDGASNSISGFRFQFRAQAVDWDRGLEIDFNGSPSITPINGASYNYDLGNNDRMFNDLYIRRLRTTQSFDVRNVANINKGWLFETSESSGTMSIRGLNGGSYTYVLGDTEAYNYFSYGYITNLRAPSSGNSSVGLSSRPYTFGHFDSFNVYGNLYAQKVTETSDRRKKKNIKNTKLGLAFINQLNPVDYEMIDSSTTRTGFIAQEMSEVLNKHNYKNQEIVSQDGQGYLGISYTQLIAPLARGLQELDTKVDSKVKNLEEIIEKQALKIADLEQRIHNLEVA
ncbi:phage tail spike protein [Oceanobacillus oncorhynchi]|uniref:phage tail spike protein n=1 Tax=Oceanobacillus oncorhynchi TaxID=545501 RepID=UPI0025A4CC1A|nr:phage tail spike protein [Oceanobacillus oncorhynchi]MDM8098655.1 phage tail spike protein [Oceanobacillus oncorhynchi]